MPVEIESEGWPLTIRVAHNSLGCMGSQIVRFLDSVGGGKVWIGQCPCLYICTTCQLYKYELGMYGAVGFGATAFMIHITTQ